jgi:uncharacterized protein (TIGR02421 family)
MTAATPHAALAVELTPASEEPPGPWHGIARGLADRLARLLRPLRVLEAVRWGKDVEEAFFAAGCRELPRVDRDRYLCRPLSFDAAHTLQALADLARHITRSLGKNHAAARLLLRRCRQALDVLDLLDARGTSDFPVAAARLYGNSRDRLASGARTLRELADHLGDHADTLAEDDDLAPEARTLGADACAELLAERLGAYFGQPVTVSVTEALEANAAVCGGWLKVRRGARFNLRDVRLLEVHEGWVHLGTSRNASAHALGPVLARALPESATTQEGLAVWTELLAFASTPARLRLLAGRVEAIALAEDGADFLEVFRYFAASGLDQRDAYQQAARVFRGGLPTAGPFPKDLAYARGFAEVGGFLRDAVRRRQTKLIPLLFCGKVSLADLPDLAELAAAGLVQRPRLLPPPFADVRALAAWLCGAALGLHAATA